MDFVDFSILNIANEKPDYKVVCYLMSHILQTPITSHIIVLAL